MRPNNSSTFVLGEQVKNSLPRIGTRCKICGEAIGVMEYIHTSTPACQSVYVHKQCAETRQYHEGFTSPSGKPWAMFAETKATADGVLLTPEVEIASATFDFRNDEQRASFLAQFGFWSEYDCTVYRELHPHTVLNLHGAKERYRNLEKVVDMKAENCGHHINASWRGMTYTDSEVIRENAFNLFRPVMRSMEQSPTNTAKVFGRGFGYWAQDNTRFVHGSWLNLANDGRIEVRLFHYASPEQIVWGFYMVKEWMKVLRRFCSGEITAEHAGKLIDKWFIKTANGTATFQRPEQNSKI